MEVTINEWDYVIPYEPGQEAHTTEMVEIVNSVVTNIASVVGQIGNERLFLMAAMMLAADNTSHARARARERWTLPEGSNSNSLGVVEEDDGPDNAG
jgi:cell division protein ZapA